MIDVFRGVGRELLRLNGNIVELAQLSGDVSNPICIIDKTANLEEFGRAGGQKVQAPKVMGYLHQEDVPNPRKGDIIRFEGEAFEIQDPRRTEDGLWEFVLKEHFDE